MAIQARRIASLTLGVGSLPAAFALFSEQLGLVVDSPGSEELEAFDPAAGASSQSRRGVLVHRDSNWGRCTLELLQWPQATAAPAPTLPWHNGISRLAIKAPDVDTLREKLMSAGVRCFAGPLTGAVSGERFCCCETDSGAMLQIVQQGGPAGLHYININCTDLLSTSRWYQRQLGFEAESDIWDETFPGEAFGAAGVVHARSQRLTLRDRETDCIIQLQQWLEPAGIAEHGGEAHRRGFYRLALEVDDLDASRHQLEHSGVQCYQAPDPVRRALDVNDPDGVRLRLIEGGQA